MKRALAAIAVLAIAPVSAFEVRPDKNLTGGSVRTGDRDAACWHGKEHRGPMFSARRDEILRRYGLRPGTHLDYEIDHLIPLCLGGSDETTWNAEAKDRLERLMCDMACSGEIDIVTARLLRPTGLPHTRNTTRGGKNVRGGK